MPTPVATVKQCLTEESAQALDEAVAVARRRGHSQTTSLHMVSSLLSLPSSTLREACSNTRNNNNNINAYSFKIQYKALELCLGVSLDRLSTSPNRVDEPPVSNSLMAAVKRSQANQRRQPENFNFYHQQSLQSVASSSSSSFSSITVVKVELRNLIASILDDPIVSRVFAEAGFRSCDIKVGVIRPVHQLFRYSPVSQRGPMFLCNNRLGSRVFNFPFSDVSWEENGKRIGEIMVRKKGSRNPVVLGVSADEASKGFVELVQRGRGRDVLPVELCGLGVICVENEISSYVSGKCDERSVESRFQEIDKLVADCVGNGVLINIGDLKYLEVESVSVDVLSFLVRKLTNLLMIHGVKVWLIGSATRHEIYLNILNRFPSIEKDLDLHVLPITSLVMPNSLGEVYPRSTLMESFVPLGGFFSVPSDVRSPFLYHNDSRFRLCNEKREQETRALPKEGIGFSVPDQSPSSLPLWLQTNCRHPNPSSLDSNQAKDRFVPSFKTAGFQKKGDSICQSHPKGQLLSKSTCVSGSQSLPTEGFQINEERNANIKDVLRKEPIDQNMRSCKLDLIQDFSVKLFPKTDGSDLVSKINDKTSKVEDERGSHGSSLGTLSGSSIGYEHTSSATSVTTNVGLETANKEEIRQNDTPADSLLEGCVSAKCAVVDLSISSNTSQSSTTSRPIIHGRIGSQEFKMLYSTVKERIGHQEEAVNITCQTIAHCRSRNEKNQGTSRGDLWLSFHGPDNLGKKNIAVALSESLYGSIENLVSVDLSFDEEMMRANALLGTRVLNTYYATSRGKTIVDYIAEKLRENPLSVILLENIEYADHQVQNSLTRAIRTGRFSDSHGREVGISNAIFVTTSKFIKGDQIVSSNESANYPEEVILKKTGQAIQLVIGFDLGDNELNSNLHNNSSRDGFVSINKRKIIDSSETQEPHGTLDNRVLKASKSFLDLNVPAEESAFCTLSNQPSEISREWLDGFLQQVDEVVVFKPVDFDALAQIISMMIHVCCKDTVDAECSLEIDKNVMVQLLAAAYFTDINIVEGWVKDVLRTGLVKAGAKYGFTSRSVVKLINCEGTHSKEPKKNPLLPSRILVN
ncbi:chaperone [Lithospermum erythrorhizon]|uniref:Chaperone n=1 Tax=Lithospermum erythrorhizon TaxID=34254 RepID=A0AAV3PKE1_LITER